MDNLFRLPSRAFDYINHNYGFIGLLVAGLALLMFLLSIYFWYDRRRA